MDFKDNYSITRHTQRTETARNSSAVMVGSFNWAILVCTVLLVAFGVVMVYSASYDKYMSRFLWNSLRNVTLGGISLVVFSTVVDFNSLNNDTLCKLLYAVSVVGLILVLVLGQVTNGAKRFIMGVQPSEFVKLFTIVILAHMIDKNKYYTTDHRGFWVCVVFFVAVPVALIGMGNASTAIILGVVCMAMLFTVVEKISWFFEVGIVAGIGGVLVLLLGKGFRMGRIKAWLDPFSDTSDTGYQVVHSLYAVASGGLSGLGLGNSREKLSYLPEAHNDMIFSIICEELGLLGAAIVVVLFVLLIFFCYRAAVNCYNTFGALVVVGITTMLAVQVIINMGVATNTIPNTGIPLPFISYGGTSMLVNLTGVGIILNVSRFFKDKRKRTQAEVSAENQ